MRAPNIVLHAVAASAFLLSVSSCDREGERGIVSPTVRVTPRIVRSASVSRELWNSTSYVYVSMRDTAGTEYADDTVPFSAGKVQSSEIPNGRSVSVAIKGLNSAKTVIWSGAGLLPGSGRDTIFDVAVDGVSQETDTSTTLKSLSAGDHPLIPAFSSGDTAYTDSVAATATILPVAAVATSANAALRIQGKPVAGGAIDSVDIGLDTTIRIEVRSPNAAVARTYSIRVVHRATYLGAFSIASGTVSPAYSPSISRYADTVVSNLGLLVLTLAGRDTFYVDGKRRLAGPDTILVDKDTTFVVLDSNGTSGRSVRDTIHVVHRTPSLSGLSTGADPMDPSFSASRTGYQVSVASNATGIAVVAEGADSLYVDGLPSTSGVARAVEAASDRNVVVLDSNVRTGKASRDTIRVVHRFPRLSALRTDTGTFSVFDSALTSFWDTVPSNLTALRIRARAADSIFVAGIPLPNDSARAVDAASDTAIVVLDSNVRTGKASRDTIHVIHRFPRLSALWADSGSFTAPFDAARTSHVLAVSRTTTRVFIHASGLDSLYVQGVPAASGAAVEAILVGDTTRIVVLDSNVRTGKSGRDTIHVVFAVPRLSRLSVDSGMLHPNFDPSITSYWDTVSSSLANLRVTASGAGLLVVNGTTLATSDLPTLVDVRKDTFVVVLDTNVYTRSASRDTIHVVHRTPRLSRVEVDSGSLSPAFGSGESRYLDSVSSDLSRLRVTAWGSDSLYLDGSLIASGVAAPTGIAPDREVVLLDSNVYTGKASRDTIRVVHQVPRLSNLVVDSGTLAPYFNTSRSSYSVAVSVGLPSLHVTATGNDVLFLNGQRITSGLPALVNAPRDTDIVVLDSNLSTAKASRDTIRVVHGIPRITGLSALPALATVFSTATTSYQDTLASNQDSIRITATGTDILSANGVPLVSGEAKAVAMPADGIVVVVDSSAGSGKASRDTIRVVHRVPSLSSLLVRSTTNLNDTTWFRSPSGTLFDTVPSNSEGVMVHPFGADSLYVNDVAVASGSPAGVVVPMLADGFLVVRDTNKATGKGTRDTVRVVHRTPVLTGLGFSATGSTLLPGSDAFNFVAIVPPATTTAMVSATGTDSIYIAGTYMRGASTTLNFAGHDLIPYLVKNKNTGKSSTYNVHVVFHGLTLGEGTPSPAFSTGTHRYVDSVASASRSLPITVTGSGTITVNGVAFSSGIAGSVSVATDGTVVVVDSGAIAVIRDTILVAHKAPVLAGLSVDSGRVSPAVSASATVYSDTVSNELTSVKVTVTGTDSLFVNETRATSGLPVTIALSGDSTRVVVRDSSTVTRRSTRDTLYIVRSGTVVDARDGKSYRWTRIGSQSWTAQNANFTSGTDSSWCYGGKASNCATYGRIYRWDAVIQSDGLANYTSNITTDPIQGVCPAGWHVPADSEWTRLLGRTGSDYGVLRSKTGWASGALPRTSSASRCFPGEVGKHPTHRSTESEPRRHSGRGPPTLRAPPTPTRSDSARTTRPSTTPT